MAMTSLLPLITALCIAQAVVGDKDSGLLFKDSVAEYINTLSPGWTAGYNEKIHSLTKEEYKGMLGTFLDNSKEKVSSAFPSIKKHKHPFVKDLPKNFDSREKWPQCSTIDEIRDQGHCGSCWAFGAVEALSDRFCVHLNQSVSLSTNDLVSCCGYLCGDGCNGGWPYKAWRYFVRRGVVAEKCQPYFDQKGCPHPGCSPVYPTPKCERQCTGEDNTESWPSSKHFAANAYVVGPKVHEIMSELYLNGPLEVDYTVYEDFVYYTGGVYRHVWGDIEGGHAVKLVGWGTTENGTDYWLIANSWSRNWGEDGYFRIVRGVNECGIEADATAGIPSAKKVFLGTGTEDI